VIGIASAIGFIAAGMINSSLGGEGPNQFQRQRFLRRGSIASQFFALSTMAYSMATRSPSEQVKTEKIYSIERHKDHGNSN